ncbi:hypothetical protein [Aquibacillus rhizosphaerae]|uniref:Uncharacterized protein n=1 Tax=Aquibacillus rhizosphaerae TaxID=3051431 RepID=A0ABT7L0T6_9BACI|nr:hypothetical protein [Aquibacillus sp. LR5S19]MDL4839415.1 hypothetical protein [Aquibacillus sp. LR5S19]
MELLLWITIANILTGLILAVITRNMESKKSSRIQSVVWGIMGIILLAWWLFTK